MRGEFERWFSEACWNLDTARELHRLGRYNAACFYAHQAAEMAVKALLMSRNESPWGHGIRALLERYSEVSGEDVSHLLSRARELDRHYVPLDTQTPILKALHMRPTTRIPPSGP